MEISQLMRGKASKELKAGGGSRIIEPREVYDVRGYEWVTCMKTGWAWEWGVVRFECPIAWRVECAFMLISCARACEMHIQKAPC